MTRSFSTVVCVVAAAIAGFALTACGSSKDDTVFGTDSGLKGKPIKIMQIYPSAGVVTFPELPEGSKAAVKAINDAGGVDGRPLELYICADGGNANTAGDCARKAVKEGVVALVGSSSTASSVTLPIMAKHKISSVGNLIGGPADFASTAAYPIVGGPITAFAAMPRYLADQGAKKIAFVRPDDPVAATAIETANIGLKPLGQKIIADVPVPQSAPDMSTYVAQTTASGADGVVILLLPAQAVNFAEKLKEEAPNIKVSFTTTQPAQAQKTLGSKANGMVQVKDFLPVPGTNTNAAHDYEAQMNALGYDQLGGYRINSWLSVRIVAELAKRLPNVTAAALTQELQKTRIWKTGLTPPLQWELGGVGGTLRSFNPCTLAAVWTADGKEKLVTGKFFDAIKNKPCPSP